MNIKRLRLQHIALHTRNGEVFLLLILYVILNNYQAGDSTTYYLLIGPLQHKTKLTYEEHVVNTIKTAKTKIYEINWVISKIKSPDRCKKAVGEYHYILTYILPLLRGCYGAVFFILCSDHFSFK